MYERGVADAERGESHPFYYQHYYHYRRGYDHARRRLRRAPLAVVAEYRWVLVAIVVAALVVVAFVAYMRPEDTPAPVIMAMQATPTASPEAARPTRTPLFPTATVTPDVSPSPVILVLRTGGVAEVSNTEGRSLRGRAAPGLKAPVRVVFVEGERVRILEGPVAADDYVWWRIEGRDGVAWAAQQSREGVVWLVPVE